MPLYDFTCGREHVTEKLTDVSVERITCHCGQQAKRQSVYPHASLRTWGSDFQVSREMRAAIDESIGYKHEAVAAMNEAVGNGWKRKQ